MSYGFRYGLVNRPASIGTIPNIAHQVEPPLSGDLGQRLSRHGVVAFQRPLTEKELVAFELALIADADLIEELAIAVAIEMLDYASEYIAQAGEEPEFFRRAVAQRIKQLRPYRVYVGELDRFARMVVSRLENHCLKSPTD